MTEVDTTKSAQQFLEDEVGGRHHLALIFTDLNSAAERVYEEVRHGGYGLPDEVVGAMRILSEYEFRV